MGWHSAAIVQAPDQKGLHVETRAGRTEGRVERACLWGSGLPSAEGRAVPGAKSISDRSPCLIPTHTVGALLVEMVATAAVGHVLLARVGALRVDARVSDGTRGTQAQTLIDIYGGETQNHVVRHGAWPNTCQPARHRSPAPHSLQTPNRGPGEPHPAQTARLQLPCLASHVPACLGNTPLLFVCLYSSPEDVFIDLREKHRCERETSTGCLPYTPDRGLNP